MRSCAVVLLAISGMVVACNESSAPDPTAPSTQASAPQFSRTATPSPSPTAAIAASADPSASAEAAPEPSATAVAEAEALPEVDIKTIGMHIGGGPNDKETKAPIRKAVESQVEALRACFGRVTEPGKGGTFGVDIRIPGEGGKATIRDPRSGLQGDGVQECMVKAFESVEFSRPPKGVAMVVSYSVRFTPR